MNQNFATPILLLIFNRPETTQKVFNQIRLVKPLYLFVAADGPRPEREDDLNNCQRARDIINQVDWDCEVKTLFRDENLGCGYAPCSAISWFFEQVEEGIILEDDCLPDPSFFRYCGELLERYKDDKDIFVISGTNLQNGIKRGEGSYYFSNYAITWGWATWRRAWNYFNYEITNIDKSFQAGDFDHVYQSESEKRFWKNNFKKGEVEKKNIWDYQWFYAICQNKGFGITPNTNLIVNIGFTNNGTHTFLRDSRREPSTFNPIRLPLIHPPKIIDREADQYTYKNAFSHSIPRFLRLIKENGLLAILMYSVRKVLKN